VLAAVTNALFTWQAKVAVEAEARRPVAQPMLARGPYTDPVWTLPTLIRCSVITLVGGAIAGEARHLPMCPPVVTIERYLLALQRVTPVCR